MKILASNPLISLIKKRIPVEVRCAALKRLEDFAPSLRFRLTRRAAARADCRACASVEDYFRFSQKWLGSGSIQKQSEIEEALTYLAS